MKKIIYFSIIFLSLSGFEMQKIPQSSTSDWGPWQKVSCYKGLQYRTVRGSQQPSGRYWWSVQFRNLYNIATDFNYNITEPEREAEVRKNKEILDYWKLSANYDPEEDGNESPHAGNYVSSSDKVFIYITNVRQPIEGNWDVPYKKCDY